MKTVNDRRGAKAYVSWQDDGSSCASYDRATSFFVPENRDSKKARLIPRLWRKRASLTSIIAILLTVTLATTSEYVVGWRSAKIVSHRLDIRNWPNL